MNSVPTDSFMNRLSPLPSHANQAAGDQSRGAVSMPSSASGAARSMSPEGAQRVVDGELDAALQKRLESAGKSEGAAAQAGSGFNPSAVAAKVLKFVGEGIDERMAEGAGKENAEAVLAQAREGVAEGMAQARETLSEMGRLSGAIAEGVERSEAMISDGLDRMAQSLEDSLSLSARARGEEAAATRVSASNRASLSESLSLQVATRDGDRVTIEMSQQYLRQASLSAASSGNAEQLSFSASERFQSRSLFQVQGELDQGERDALNELFDEVESMAAKFFQGDTQAALEQASEFRMDASELGQFSLDMNRQAQTTATRAYESVGRMSDEPASARGASESMKGPLAELGGQLEAMVSRASERFQQAGDMLGRLTDARLGAESPQRAGDGQSGAAHDKGRAMLKELASRLG